MEDQLAALEALQMEIAAKALTRINDAFDRDDLTLKDVGALVGAMKDLRPWLPGGGNSGGGPGPLVVRFEGEAEEWSM